MYTVYGIYEVGGDKPLYIGCTILPLKVRFSGHLTNGLRLHRHGSKTVGAKLRLKAEWMYKHSVGIVTLEMRTISRHRDKRLALVREQVHIRRQRPILNTVVGKIRKGRVVTRRVPVWYVRYLNLCAKKGEPAVRIATFDRHLKSAA